MDFETALQEWLECRRTVARFDDYLLRLRLLGFSIFALLFTGISGLAGSSVAVEGLRPETLLFALITLSLYVSAIYILDRYYERMLLVAVLRASRLEAFSLEGFRVGLTTEIQFQKEQLRNRTRRGAWKASNMVNGVYLLIFLCMWVQYWLVADRLADTDLYFTFLVVMILIVTLLVISAHVQLTEPNALIAERAEVVTSPIVMSPREIRSAVQRIAYSIAQWLVESDTRELQIVSVVFGARAFTEDLVDAIERVAEVRCFVHPVHMEATRDDKVLGQAKHEYGSLLAEHLTNQFVLVVDDLVDSGATLSAILALLAEAKPKQVRSAVLIKKYSEVAVQPDYLGLELGLDRKAMEKSGIEDYWLFGYGMDSGGFYRELAHVGWIARPRSH